MSPYRVSMQISGAVARVELARDARCARRHMQVQPAAIYVGKSEARGSAASVHIVRLCRLGAHEKATISAESASNALTREA